jgi:hypothetical protein
VAQLSTFGGIRTMTLSYDFTEEDLSRWYQYSFRASPRSRIARKQHVVIWFAVYVCLASAAVLVFQTYPAAFIGYGLAAVFTFTTWRGYDQRIDIALKAQAADPQVKGSFGQVQLTLSAAEMREVTPATDSTVKWQSVMDVVRDGDYVFVRLATGQAAVIPRRSYSGPVAFDEIPQAIIDFRQKHIAERDGAPNAGSAGAPPASVT